MDKKRGRVTLSRSFTRQCYILLFLAVSTLAIQIYGNTPYRFIKPYPSSKNIDFAVNRVVSGFGRVDRCIFSYQPLPINYSSKKYLETIPGIGTTQAAEIIKIREQIEYFNDLEDLMLVKGIADKRAAKLKKYISFDHDAY